MCALFGIIDYQNVLTTRQKNKILSVLSRECEVRGTDATGIAYNFGRTIHVYKRPLAARRMRFHIPNGVRVVMGHTRMTTQGNAKLNYNNHPWATQSFALAHNGVLWNDRFLKETESLPYTLIETDSYVAVQLLEKERTLNFQSLKRMAEKVQGSFVFTILDRKNNVYFVRGDNPLAIFCYDGFYLYASTEEILFRAEQQLKLYHYESIETHEGDILRINNKGQCSFSTFQPEDSWMHRSRYPGYWDELDEELSPSSNYLTDIARTMGVPAEDIQLLFDYGCGYDEVEELLYDPQLLYGIVSEIRADKNRREVQLWV